VGDESRRVVESALCRKGFKRLDGKHRKFVFYLPDGRKTSIWTETSHGSKHRRISETNLRWMAKQCRISYQEFKRLIDCPLSREDYEGVLAQNGFIRY
jgi:hypothetical protein